jgi:hypothetical protein
MCFHCAVLNIPFCLLSKRGDFIYLYIYFSAPPKQLERASETCSSLCRELETLTAIGGGECSFQFDP